MMHALLFVGAMAWGGGAPSSGSGVPYQLGKSYDASQLSLWDMTYSGSGPSTVLSSYNTAGTAEVFDNWQGWENVLKGGWAAGVTSTSEACAVWARSSDDWGALANGTSLTEACQSNWAQQNCAKTCADPWECVFPYPNGMSADEGNAWCKSNSGADVQYTAWNGPPVNNNENYPGCGNCWCCKLKKELTEGIELGAFPQTCYSPQESSCATGMQRSVTKFSNMKEAYTYIRSYSNFKASVGVGAISATINSAYGKTDSSYAKSDSSGAFAVLMNRRACHSLNDECLMNSAALGGGFRLSPVFMQFLQNQKRSSGLTDGTNIGTLEKWQPFVKMWGTSVVTTAINGASIKLTELTGTTLAGSSDCATHKLCAGIGGTAPTSLTDETSIGAKASGCSGGSSCNEGGSQAYDMKGHCAMVGGEDSAANLAACNTGTPSETTINSFLASGASSGTDTVIGYKMMRLDNLLSQLGGDSDLSQTLGSAIEYYMCMKLNTPELTAWKWDTSAQGTNKCVCALTNDNCQNGGTIDTATCTCQCRAHKWQGWKGPFCEQSFGTCQPGDGSGNWGAAQNCAYNGNKCSSNYVHNQCQATEVCCITDFGGTCCPFGSSCNCGTHSCSCRNGRSTFLDALEAPEARATNWDQYKVKNYQDFSWTTPAPTPEPSFPPNMGGPVQDPVGPITWNGMQTQQKKLNQADGGFSVNNWNVRNVHDDREERITSILDRLQELTRRNARGFFEPKLACVDDEYYTAQCVFGSNCWKDCIKAKCPRGQREKSCYCQCPGPHNPNGAAPTTEPTQWW